MVFSSIVFLFYFLPVFVTAYVLLKPFRAGVVVLGSLIFYGWDDPARMVLLVGFILFNWAIGQAVAGGRGRGWLAVGCVGDVGLLVYFKYKDFLVAQANTSLAALGILPWHVPSTVLPLGISFFTFQGLSYLIDIRRGVVRPQRSLLKFAMYKAMFPQLIAGPIVRYSQIADEIDERRLDVERAALGVRFFIVGLAQKTLIANSVAPAADGVFALPHAQMTLATAWLGAVCYTVQIYFDFAGYSNMAIGLGQILGFSLPRNFDNPYVSRSMTEFWRRWHISLSTWFRDYVYIPLGGNRCGPVRTYGNLLITFVLCGLWHGAAWTFALWGLYHGCFLIAERIGRGVRLPPVLLPLRHAYVLLAVVVGWVFFRAGRLGDAAGMVATMAGFGHPDAAAWPVRRFATPSVLAALAAALLVVTITDLRGTAAEPRFGFLTVLSLLLLFAWSTIAISSGTYNPFVYFRF